MFKQESEKDSNSPKAAASQLASEAPSPDYKVYYHKTAAARAALAEEDVLDINIHVPTVVNVAAGAVHQIGALKEQMVGLPVDLDAIVNVGIYAGALAYAQALYTVETAPPPEMQALYEHLLGTRTLLRLDAVNLAARKIINEQALQALNGDTGFNNVAYDVMSLVSMHEAAAEQSAGRTAVTAEDLAAATADASNFLTLVAQREQQLKTRSELKEQRRRAFTLLVNAYDEARRVVTFLLWKQPEKFLTSLYGTRGGGRPKNANTPPGSDVPTPQTPAPGAVTTPEGNAQPAATPVDATATVPGGRGGNPFDPR